MQRTLEAHDKLIREIFGGDYQFQIPDYQRPYAWTTEQAEELFTDLLTAMRDGGPSGDTGQYFLGSIVLIKKDRDSKSDVVDGQQRLTTLTILLAAMREMMPDVARGITTFLYNEGILGLDQNNEYRLIAREEDADFFRLNIQEDGGIRRLVAGMVPLVDSQLRFKENAALLLKKVEALTAAERLGLWRFVATSCSLVVISTPDFEAAYRIFSVLNNRGLDLAPIDIFKADVLGKIRKISGNVVGKAYTRKWSDMETRLGRDAFGELFVHVRSLYAKRKQKATLVKEFQEYVSDYKQPANLVDDVLMPYAEVWDDIRNADFASTQHAEPINNHLTWLNRVDFKDWVPPALLYFRRFREKPTSLVEFFGSLEKLTYFLAVTRVGINERIEKYAQLVGEIEQSSFTGNADELPSLALDLFQRREFLSALDGDIYRKLPKVRMPLMLLLESLSSDGSARPVVENISLEHVLPQTPPNESEWLDWFQDDASRDSWTHRIANLVPLHVRKNPAASNYDFNKKKLVYFSGRNGTRSPFVLTSEVQDQVAWTPEILEHRQQKLVKKLATYWGLPHE